MSPQSLQSTKSISLWYRGIQFFDDCNLASLSRHCFNYCFLCCFLSTVVAVVVLWFYCFVSNPFKSMGLSSFSFLMSKRLIIIYVCIRVNVRECASVKWKGWIEISIDEKALHTSSHHKLDAWYASASMIIIAFALYLINRLMDGSSMWRLYNLLFRLNIF